MKVSLVQSSIEWMQPEINWASAERWISKSVDSDMVILPEMFTTGFCMTPEKVAQSCCEVVSKLKELSQRYGVTIVGSVAVEECGEYYNRLYCVRRDGSYEHYDKRHLFTFSGEDKRYAAGKDRVVVEVDGVRFLLLVCYDLRFPVWARNRGDYDVMICVANWPESRRQVWDILLRARAIENVSYMCGVNIVGVDPSASYSGGTAVVDYRGRVVSSVADGECGVATVEIDLEALRAFREKFPALGDADCFEIREK